MKTLLITMSLAAIGCGQSTPMFSPDERDAVLRFWNEPDRYVVGLPADASEKGIWQVRLTVPGSTWLWKYQKGKRNPLQDMVPTTEEGKRWEAWVAARIARDRWDAFQTARRENVKAIGRSLPAPDATIPATEPADPGPVPTDLKAAVGEPPAFAEAATPMQHEIAFGDFRVKYRDRYRPGNPRYAYFRSDQGVGDAGTSVRAVPAERLDRLFQMAGVTEREAKVMRAVSLLEGGFDSVNTYDTGYVSVGFIQFACLKEGAGALGAMLRSFKTDEPEEFERTFRAYGLDVTAEGRLVALDLGTGNEAVGAAAAAKIIDDKRLIAVFQRAGGLSDAFVAAQIKAAKTMFMPLDDPITVTLDGRPLTGKVSDFIRSEAGLAVLMDRKVNTGGLNPLAAILSEIVTEVRPASLADLSPYERRIVASLKYRKDYLAEATLSQPPASPARATTPTSRGAGGARNSRSEPRLARTRSTTTTSRGSGGKRNSRRKSD